MTVAELIEQLTAFPQNSPVYVRDLQRDEGIPLPVMCGSPGYVLIEAREDHD